MFKKISVLLSILLISGNSFAGWFGGHPVPPDTEQARKDVRKFAGLDFDFIFYNSSLGRDEIKEFYRKELVTRGWQESDSAEAASRLSDPNNSEAFNKTFAQYNPTQFSSAEMSGMIQKMTANQLSFKKDKDIFIVNFLPEGVSRRKGTYYNILTGKVDPEKLEAEDVEVMPELVGKPKKDVVPVYPGAHLANLFEYPGSYKASYMSQDSIEAIADFYREKMPNQGWSLDNEKPVSSYVYKDGTMGSLTENCPDCQKAGIDLKQKVETLTAELRFINDRGDTFIVNLSRVELGMNTGVVPQFTNIMVRYAEKKK